MDGGNLTLAQFLPSEGVSVKKVRSWILVIHYSFEGDIDLFRANNEADVQNLKSTFKEYQNCRFRDLASPKLSAISQIFSQNGLKKLFINDNEKDEEPNLLVLFILSHGRENGKILTNSKKDGAYEYFSTFEVWDLLAKNELLQDCLKINFFGPCRGNFKEIRTNDAEALPVRINATRILQSPNKINFVNFFSTVESTLSYVDLNLGSSLVAGLTKTLKGLSEDVDVQEFLRLVAKNVINSCCLADTQTPQFSLFPHNKLIFCKRPNPFLPVQNEAQASLRNIITSERHEFYPWISQNNKIFKRGTALVCGLSINKLEKQLMESLETLEFEPQFVQLSKTEETLCNLSISGLMESEGCLFVVVNSSIVDLGIKHHTIIPSENREYDQQCSGLAVNLENSGLVPIGILMQKFLNSNCPAVAGKPKIFIFINSSIGIEGITFTNSNNMMFQMAPTNDHSGFLACICNDADALLRGLNDPSLANGKASLQEILTNVVRDSQNEHNDLQRTIIPQVWSTMYLKLDFPKCKDMYIPHNFRNRQDISNTVTFSELVHNFQEENDKMFMIIAPPGMGKSRASEEIYTQLLVKFPNYFIVHIRLSTRIKTIDELMNNPKVFYSNVEELFLKNCVGQTKSAELSARLAQGRLFIILDGFDEICPDYRDNVIDLMTKLRIRGARILVTSRPQEKDHIQNSFPNICTYELLEFNKRDKLLMLKTRLHLLEEECATLLSSLEKSLKDFASNPLHLQMLCEIYQNNRQELKNVYTLYEKFVEQKVEQGLAKCRQVDRNAYSFNKIRTRILKLLEKCALNTILFQNKQSLVLSETEVEDINISGIATATYGSSIVDFVHRTFAEFLTAHRFVALAYSPLPNLVEITGYFRNVYKISGVVQTMKFADSGLADANIEPKIFLTVIGQKTCDAIFNTICIIGLPELYALFSKAFSKEYITTLIKQSHESSEFCDWLFLQACSSSIELAEKLVDVCPPFESVLPKLNEALEWLAQRTSSSSAFRIFLRKVPKWNTVELNISSFYSREQFEFLIDNVPGLLNRLVYDLKNEKGEPLPPTRESLIQQFEKRNKAKNYIFYSHHDYDLARNVDRKIRDYRFTYDSSAALEACVQGDVSKLRDLHAQGQLLNEQNSCGLAAIHKAATLQDTSCLRVLIGCALGHLFVPNQGESKIVHRSESDWKLVEKELCAQDKEGFSPLHWASDTNMGENTFNLLLTNILGDYYVMEGKEIKPRTDEDQQMIERMLHTPDCIGRTPLSLVVDRGNSSAVVQLLLSNMLGRLFVPVDGSVISERSADDQECVERLLCVAVSPGMGIINNVVIGQNISTPCIALIVSNLLGELYVVNGKAARKRSNHEQELVEKLINSRNEDGRTPLSYVINKGHIGAFEVLLQNLLGDLFIPLEAPTCAPRSAEDSRCVERILCCRDGADQTPTHWAVFAHAENVAIVELLTRNILAEQFIFKGKETLAERTGKEQESVAKLSNPSNKQKKTLLELAEKGGHVGAVDVLKRNLHVSVIPSVGKSVLTATLKFVKFFSVPILVIAFAYIAYYYTQT